MHGTQKLFFKMRIPKYLNIFTWSEDLHRSVYKRKSVKHYCFYSNVCSCFFEILTVLRRNKKQNKKMNDWLRGQKFYDV